MQETFSELLQEVDDETVRRYVRAYIMMLLSMHLFGDKSCTRLHIRWLPYVTRLEDIGRYSWGFAALSWLYRCMCRVANRNIVKLVSPLQLLQSWIFWRFPSFRPDGFDVFHRPLASSLPGVVQVVHPEILEPRHMALWRAATDLIYFAVIEWHQVDQVLPQLGGIQHRPRAALDIDFLMSKNGRGGDRWFSDTLQSWHIHWANMAQYVL
ncbi:hypothetical protein Ahy_B02g061047 [Arachis hypogaea]|uniref:Aminotransferase-like plant mobile domain-containing protein n=1 Tax=Arachis hypogaea TaxID=3818 RepID=A0A445AJY8_ARAHY|nr:hypothetical protein Ahy_B02g061047 [Arachis hypogaea]